MGLEERLKGSAGEELGRLSVCAKRPNPRVWKFRGGAQAGMQW